MPKFSNPAQLSLLGASKGGRARAQVLTAEERKAIAKAAAQARWAKDNPNAPSPAEVETPSVEPVPAIGPDGLPYSLFPGNVEFGNLQVECHVLSDFRRVFTQREVVRVLSDGRESGNLQRYVARNPLFEEGYLEARAFRFRIGPSVEALGYEAEHLIDICDRYIEAKHQGKLRSPSQDKLVRQAEIVMRACAKTGIIALVDEATGFQKVRAQHALQLKLQAFIAEELQEWARMFPDEFWYELARLEGVRYSPRHRPLRWGRYIMMFVYDAVDEDVGNALREKNPNPRFLKNHHQWLKEHGRDQVNNQIQRVITIMKLCTNMDEFREKFATVFKRAPTKLPFEDLWTAV
jgi:P63C domain